MNIKETKRIFLSTAAVMIIGMTVFSTRMAADAKEEMLQGNTGVTAPVEAETASADEGAAPEETDESGIVVTTNLSTLDVDEQVAGRTPWVTDEKLQKNRVPEVNQLIRDFLIARLSGDRATLETLVDDPAVLDLEDMAERVNGIAGYTSVDCYTLPGPENESYMVFVAVSERITGISDTVSGLDGFYVRPDQNGELKIVLGEISDDVQLELNKLYEHPDVAALIDDVNQKFLDEVNASEELQAYIRELMQASSEG